MKVFISSVIGGYGHFRDAGRSAADTLGHTVITAEDFPAVAVTPQQACLAGVREADVVVLLIGESYGAVQPTGLSATHEEYREARERKPVLVFVEAGVAPEPQQAQFLAEVQAWATGHFRATYSDPPEMGAAPMGGAVSSPFDPVEVLKAGRCLLARSCPRPRYGSRAVARR